MKPRIPVYNWLVLLFLIFSWAAIAKADELPVDFKLDAGYRLDNLRWNIAGDTSGENPNILSELTWSDLKVLQINSLATIPLRKSLFLQGSINFGVIISGNNQDSDYLGDNRTEEFSRSNNNGNGDNTLDLSISLGHYLTGSESKFRPAAIIGYAFHQQNMRMTGGYQTINIDPDSSQPGETGPFSGLNSTYKASWTGPWIGTSLTGNVNPDLNIFGGFEYHWVNYEGNGNWNLRDDLAHPVSFTHNAVGSGYRWSAGILYTPNSQINLTLKYNSGIWSTGPGIDRVFGAYGATGTTRLNEVVWTSHALMLAISWKPMINRQNEHHLKYNEVIRNH